MEHQWSVISAFVLLMLVQGTASNIVVSTQSNGPTWINLEIRIQDGQNRPEVVRYKITYGEGRAMSTRYVRRSLDEEKGTMVTLTDLEPASIYPVTVTPIYADGRMGSATDFYASTAMDDIDDYRNPKRGDHVGEMASSATKPMMSVIIFIVIALHVVL